MTTTIDLFAPSFIDNPYAVYAELIKSAPIARIEPYGACGVSRYEDVVHVLKNPELFSSAGSREKVRLLEEERLRKESVFTLESSMVSADPPDHTRLRKLVAGAFTPKAIARLEARIHSITSELIDQILQKDSFDMIADLAAPLPVIVIAEMLGVDPARRADFKRWSDDAINAEQSRKRSPEEVDRMIQSRREFRAFFNQMIEERRKSPREDLLSDLCRAEVENDTLTADEVFGMAILLMIAGNETTTNLIGNGTLLLLEHPETLAELRATPSLIPAFIEETLRYYGPVGGLLRRTTREVTLAGVTLPKNEFVMALVAAANRDPAQFPDPDRFDIHREQRGHVAFGLGIHFCVGAPLSRVEGRIAFEELLRRLPPFSLKTARPDWLRSPTFRGLRTLPIDLDRARAAA